MSLKVMLTDGYVCSKCWAETGRTDMAGAATLSSNNVRNFINLRKESQSLISKFSATKEIGSHAKFDDNSKTFMIGKNIFRYQNLLDYELIEDGETITKGGLGRAVAGGVLFGGVGAIVGGVTGLKRLKIYVIQ